MRPATVSAGLIKWLAEPQGAAPAEVKAKFLGQLLSSPGAIVMGALNGLIINGVALAVDRGSIFATFLVLEIACAALRLKVISTIVRPAAGDEPQVIDTAVTMSILWCALQGLVAFFAMRTDICTLQVLSATMIMGVIGPISARNYPAPRLTLLLIMLCDLPFVAGGCTSGRLWLMVLLPMTPPFLFGAWQVTRSLQRMALASLCAEWQSRQRANHDAMTGLQNRLAFNDMMKQRALEADCAFALLCLDLDGFKAVNDTLGHDAGDRVLIAVGDRLKAGVRPVDNVFRLGGDEFSIIVQGLGPPDVKAFAQRIIDTVAVEEYRFAGLPPIRIGVSIGLACYPEDGSDVSALHRQADLALYASKAAGKGVLTRFDRAGAACLQTVS